MTWLDDLMKFPGNLKKLHSTIKQVPMAELRELFEANSYAVASAELAQFNTQKLPGVNAFIEDIQEMPGSPTMTNVLSFLAGENLQSQYKEVFGKKWQEKIDSRKNWAPAEDNLKVLMLYAQSNGLNPDNVEREFEIRKKMVELMGTPDRQH